MVPRLKILFDALVVHGIGIDAPLGQAVCGDPPHFLPDGRAAGSAIVNMGDPLQGWRHPILGGRQQKGAHPPPVPRHHGCPHRAVIQGAVPVGKIEHRDPAEPDHHVAGDEMVAGVDPHPLAGHRIVVIPGLIRAGGEFRPVQQHEIVGLVCTIRMDMEGLDLGGEPAGFPGAILQGVGERLPPPHQVGLDEDHIPAGQGLVGNLVNNDGIGRELLVAPDHRDSAGRDQLLAGRGLRPRIHHPKRIGRRPGRGRHHQNECHITQ